MANKITKRVATDAELRENNIKSDYFEDTRSNNGFIKVGLKVTGTSLINDSIEKSIMSKQKELERLKKQHSAVEYVVDESKERERYLFNNEDKQKKKEKKDEKKKKKAMKNMSESTKLLMGAIDEYKDTYIKSKKHKDDDDDEDGFDGVRSIKKGIKKEEDDDETKAKKKADAEEKEFNRRFDEPITLMKQNLIELDKTSKEIDELIAEAREGRAKGRSVMLKDLLGSKVGIYSNKTNAIGKLADMQKVRIELSLKKAKEEGPDLNQKNKDIMAISRAMPFLLANTGKKKDKDDDDDNDRKKDKSKKWKDKKYNADDDEDKFDKHAAKLLANGKIELTPHEAAISIENKYTAAIKKSFKNQDWCVIALDNKTGNEIKNFTEKYGKILPKKKNLNLKFDDERGCARDKATDQMFQVIMVPYI